MNSSFRISIFMFVAVVFALVRGDCCGESNSGDFRSKNVLVTIAPYEYIVKRIGGDTIQVQSIVPPSANSHTFAPTPKQVFSASKADLWFRTGESFEDRVISALQSHNDRLRLVDLRESVDLIRYQNGHSHYCPECSGSSDVHIWLSPKEMKAQAKTIAKALSQQYPENSKQYNESLALLLEELDDLDNVMQTLLKPLQNRVIMVSHPAYAYLARDYDLKQISIEFEGKEPTAKQLTQILQLAKEYKIQRIFTQAQFNNKGARLVAEKLGVELVELDPYSDQYISNMRSIAQRFAGK